MNFSEQLPSKHWAALKYRGEKFAEVWFKPADEPFALIFRIRPESFQIPGMAQALTTELLLKAVGITAEEVESWEVGDSSHDGMDGTNPELREPLPQPAEDATHLDIHVTLKQPSEVEAPEESGEPEAPSAEGEEQAIPSTSSTENAEPQAVPTAGGGSEGALLRWIDLEARWRAIMDAEMTIENLRLMLEGLEAQMDTAAKKTLTTEEKLHARKSDVTTWTKAKTRVHHATPKVKEFVHRATWVVGTPERKKLEELFKDDEQRPEMPLPQMIKLVDQLENLLKDRQILCAQGVTVCQECRTVAAGMQNSLRTLQTNAAVNADRKRRAGKYKGKFFKDIRKWSGAD
jgi:hypothetical protein